jgi:NADPH:quinone reductase-like Zn-dependent oxidoreductase
MRSTRILVAGKGGPDVLKVVKDDIPEPGPGEIRIRVEASGVAYADTMRRRGVLAPRRPFTPGYDVVGRVDAVGEGVEGMELGGRVAALMPRLGLGGYSEHVVVPANLTVRVPQRIDPIPAVCLGLNYITAYQMLFRFTDPRPGDRILIHGAAGGTGTALLQLGRHKGLEMYGTASAPKHDLVRELGATPIDYRSEDFVERILELTDDGVDYVYDPIGGKHLARSYQTLRPSGTLVSYGASSDIPKGTIGVGLGSLRFLGLKLRPSRRGVRLYMITMSKGCKPADCKRDWEHLLQLYLDGVVDPIVGASFPLERAADAHALMDRSGTRGKIVLLCGEDREAPAANPP